nr:acyl-CoA dehydrogenase family protein [Jiella avicenniae]
MQESASGSFSLEGIAADAATRLGRPGDYRIEPFFEGGIWRCAAVHLGAVEAILGMMARHLDGSGRLDHPLQAERLGQAVMHARTARLWVEDAARRIEAPKPDETIPQAVAASSYTRLQVERDALAVMELARRSVGLPSFASGHPLDRATADLSVYLRQANPDALLLNKCRAMAEAYL